MPCAVTRDHIYEGQMSSKYHDYADKIESPYELLDRDHIYEGQMSSKYHDYADKIESPYELLDLTLAKIYYKSVSREQQYTQQLTEEKVPTNHQVQWIS